MTDSIQIAEASSHHMTGHDMMEMMAAYYSGQKVRQYMLPNHHVADYRYTPGDDGMIWDNSKYRYEIIPDDSVKISRSLLNELYDMLTEVQGSKESIKAFQTNRNNMNSLLSDAETLESQATEIRRAIEEMPDPDDINEGPFDSDVDTMKNKINALLNS